MGTELLGTAKRRAYCSLKYAAIDLHLLAAVLGREPLQRMQGRKKTALSRSFIPRVRVLDCNWSVRVVPNDEGIGTSDHEQVESATPGGGEKLDRGLEETSVYRRQTNTRTAVKK